MARCIRHEIYDYFKGKRGYEIVELLRKFHKIATEKGRIIAETRDSYKMDDPEHISYHEWSRERRLPGQVRIRIRYRKYVTPLV